MISKYDPRILNDPILLDAFFDEYQVGDIVAISNYAHTDTPVGWSGCGSEKDRMYACLGRVVEIIDVSYWEEVEGSEDIYIDKYDGEFGPYPGAVPYYHVKDLTPSDDHYNNAGNYVWTNGCFDPYFYMENNIQDEIHAFKHPEEKDILSLLSFD